MPRTTVMIPLDNQVLRRRLQGLFLQAIGASKNSSPEVCNGCLNSADSICSE